MHRTLDWPAAPVPQPLPRPQLLRVVLYLVLVPLALYAFRVVFEPEFLFAAILFFLAAASIFVCLFRERALTYLPVWGILPFAFLPLGLGDRLSGRAPLPYLVFLLPFMLVIASHILTGHNYPRLVSRRLLVASALLTLVFVFAVLHARDLQEAFVYGAAWALNGFVLLPGMARLSLRWDRDKLISRVVASVAALSLLGIGKFIVVRDGWLASNPIRALDNNAVIFLTVPVGVLAFAWLTVKPSWGRALAFSLIAGQVALSRSRTGVIGLVIGILVVTALSRVKSARSRFVAWMIVILLALATVTANSSGIIDLHKFRYVTDVVGIWTGGRVSVYDLSRRAIAQGAMKLIEDHFVLGTGLGLENYLDALQATGIDPGPRGYKVAHNLYLTYFAQLGVIGFAVLMGFFTLLTVELFGRRARARDPGAKLVLGGLIGGHLAILVMLAGNEFIIAPFVWWFWGLALGIAYGQTRTPPSQPQHASRRAPTPPPLRGTTRVSAGPRRLV